jgi:predicted ATPase/class 3 adenylate cyclase
VNCPRCQAENRDGARFCRGCGAPFAAVCSACGAKVEAGSRFCDTCGAPLASTPTPAAEPLRAAPREARAADDVPTVIRPSTGPADAERRQLTVMFCDLVDSTQLSGRLDPEVLREVVRSYQRVCGDVIARFQGYVAQYLGDGLLVYFGYPAAHEDDAPRAVQAALAILVAIETLNARLQPDNGVELAMRVGIHTGLVVVGKVGGGGREEDLALGEAPNVAARLQGLADAGTVLISDATYRLVHGLFSCQDLGSHDVKGLSTPLHAYRVTGAGAAQTRLDLSVAAGLTPLVGREQEVGLLLGRWDQAKDGLGQVVLLSGEAGIGKSRLVRVLKEHVASEPHTRWECRCSAYHQDSALHPMIDLFEHALTFSRDDAPAEKLRKLELGLARYDLARPDTVALWASFLSVPLPERYPALRLTPQRHKQKTFEAIATLLLALATEHPMVFIVEDLHWVDPSTLELLSFLFEQVPAASILAVLTFRPEFQPPWSHRAHVTHLTVDRFTRKQTEVMVERVTGGRALPREVLREVSTKTDGVPLFVEELTKMVLESGLVREHGDQYELNGPLPPLAIPATLQDSLMARLDRLATVKDVAQLGAALGRAFRFELLRAVATVDEEVLRQALDKLVSAELLYQRGVAPAVTYIFKHALVQETAYQSMLKSRRQQLHQRIAQVLADRFPQTAEMEPELLAHHYTEAGLVDQATSHWLRAGKRAFRRGANTETIAHLTKGLEVLRSLTDGRERRGREFELQAALGMTLMTTKGYAAREVEQTYLRALELSRQTENLAQRFAAVWGLFWVSMLRAELHTCREVGEELVRLAETVGDPALLVQGHNSRGQNAYYVGDLRTARHHLERTIAICDSGPHDFGDVRGQIQHAIASRAHLALALWCLGFPAQALERSREALALAQTEAQPLGRAYALGFAAMLHQLRREETVAQAQAEAMIELSREQGLPFWLAMATFRLGAALTGLGGPEEGIEKMREGLEAWRATGAELERPYRLSVLVEAYGRLGQIEAARGAVAEALTTVKKSGEAVWEAELHRLQGELFLAQPGEHEREADACFRQAIDIARGQQGKSLELRAAMSLSRVLKRQGKREDARRLLADVYDWFTEGFDTADLKDARALLDELARS